MNKNKIIDKNYFNLKINYRIKNFNVQNLRIEIIILIKLMKHFHKI